jgi:REP element-mobilizing transposase RayT
LIPALEMLIEREYTDPMSRKMRIEYPGALYHVTARGNCRSDIFIKDDDRYRYLDILSDTISQYNLVCHAYCLMTNHYHLMIETPDGNLSTGIHRLNSVYANYFNWKHERVGHLFQGRFNAIIVQKESYLLELCRYIVLNPVRARIVNEPMDYEWSSYRDTVSIGGRFRSLLTTNWILSFFDHELMEAREKYRAFVFEGIHAKSPMDDIKGNLVLGDEHFVKQLKQHIGNCMNDREIPVEQRFLFRNSLEELFGDPKSLNKEKRNNLILEACNHLGYAQIEVSTYLNLNRRTISRIVGTDRSC